MSSASSDPSNFVTDPPSTVVKVVNTSRDDANGKFGIVVGYQADRGRYLVHRVDETQSTMALKPENLTKASTVEQYQAQYSQFRNDPRIQRELRTYYDKAKAMLHPVKPEHAALAALVLLVLCMYFVGFTKTLMVLSIVLMIGVLVGPDVVGGGGSKTVLRNFPMRCREAIEQSLPFVKGKLTNQMALGIVVLMLIFAGRSLLLSSKTATGSTSQAPAAEKQAISQSSRDYYYKLGFDDAKQDFDFGRSLKVDTGDAVVVDRTVPHVDGDFSDWDTAMPPPAQPKSKSSLGIGTAMSGWFLFRTFKELGTDVAGGWNYQRALANLRTLEAWKMGMMAFSVYNVVRAFV